MFLLRQEYDNANAKKAEIESYRLVIYTHSKYTHKQLDLYGERKSIQNVSAKALQSLLVIEINATTDISIFLFVLQIIIKSF